MVTISVLKKLANQPYKSNNTSRHVTAHRGLLFAFLACLMLLLAGYLDTSQAASAPARSTINALPPKSPANRITAENTITGTDAW
ncbi:MAG: hypothetical protein M3014_05480, partial [Chloroflexota bacterium]|nr:hypothetical protein [Chloroflexota bacterium]